MPIPSGRKRHLFAMLHRYGGISSALLVIVICTTGLLLNHTDDLNLSKQTVGNEWLLDWYGIKTPSTVSYISGSHYASQLNESIYFDGVPVEGSYTHLQGLAVSDNGVIIATTNQLIILTPEAALIEVLDARHGIPEGIENFGLLPSGAFVLNAKNTIWIADNDLLEWVKTNNPIDKSSWSTHAALPSSILNRINQNYHGSGLSTERILLDLHSGRIFGRAGPWLADAVAILFIILAATGTWMWFKSHHKTG
ncbi:MAG: PepSY domain-containing protein [Gammaproteobacteria bacterium]|nr:PepSY domain-containing protein [Gammaproteobacteria bacterium]MCP4089400.1 PepSY domain-containing protein [Gammaproteobacteria bacterium]MCP4277515.1 PepSY domain-containing protein [Gammaproteobacteria bacterium]MCP4831123.1 PepSY domain-containing protein [Gammaproteobacteria bacterium]